MKAAVAHSYPRHGGQPRACGAHGSVSPELPLTADAALAGCQHERHGSFLPPVKIVPVDLAGRFGARSFSRDELKNRCGSGPLPPRTVAIGGRERIPVRSARLQSIHQPLHDVVQGLPPHANPAHRSLQFVMPAVTPPRVRPGIARVPDRAPAVFVLNTNMAKGNFGCLKKEGREL